MGRSTVRKRRDAHAGAATRENCGERRSGFTAVEVVIVAVLVGIVAAMAVPRINYERFRADAAMRGVSIALQTAQRNAIMRQTNVVVSFDASGRRVRMLEDANNNCAVDPGERQYSRPLEEGTRLATPPVGYSGAVTAAVSTTDQCTVSGLPTVQFLRDGASSSDLEVYLTSSRGTRQDFRLVRVMRATGRTQLYKFDGGAWRATN